MLRVLWLGRGVDCAFRETVAPCIACTASSGALRVTLALRIQREIAETLSQQPAPEVEATTTAESVPVTQRLSTFWQTRVAQPVSHAWAAVAAWLASVWAAFVNWTVSLGEYVKRTFFRKG